MKDMTFEQALKKLEETVEKLESKDLSLDESMKLYSQGNELSAFCLKCLDIAQIKITDISEVDSAQVL